MASGNDEFQVPVGWYRAEYTAGRVITLDPRPPTFGTLSFRATQAVLALTLFISSGTHLSETEVVTDKLAAHLDEDVHVWRTWCWSGLIRPQHGGNAADLRLAGATMRWLAQGRLLAEIDAGYTLPPTGPVNAETIGMLLARRIVRNSLSRRDQTRRRQWRTGELPS